VGDRAERRWSTIEAMPEPRGGPPGGDDGPPSRRQLLDILAIAFVFPIALVLGYFVGRTVGGWLGSEGAGGVVGAVLGALAGFSDLVRTVRRAAPR